MAGGGVLFTVELNARTRIRLHHEAVVRARRGNPALHGRRRIQRDELIRRIGHHRRVHCDAGRYPGVSGDCQLTPWGGSAHCIYINRATRVYMVQKHRQSRFLDLRRGQTRRKLREIELHQSDAPRAANRNSGRRPEVTAVAQHVVGILRWGQRLGKTRDGR